MTRRVASTTPFAELLARTRVRIRARPRRFGSRRPPVGWAAVSATALRTRSPFRARSGVKSSRCSGRGAANSSSSPSHLSSWCRGMTGRSPPRCRPSPIGVSTRISARSRESSLTRSRISTAPATASAPAPITNIGRPSSVSHHLPASRCSVRLSSASPRRTLATSVVTSPSPSPTPAAARRPRNTEICSVHHGRRTSCPSARRTTSTGPATWSSPACSHPDQPLIVSAATRIATEAPLVTRAPAYGPSSAPSRLMTRCAPSTDAAPSARESLVAIRP